MESVHTHYGEFFLTNFLSYLIFFLIQYSIQHINLKVKSCDKNACSLCGKEEIYFLCFAYQQTFFLVEGTGKLELNTSQHLKRLF